MAVVLCAGGAAGGGRARACMPAAMRRNGCWFARHLLTCTALYCTVLPVPQKYKMREMAIQELGLGGK